ncbi:LACTB2, winged helix domain [Dillenia turbinata]|uniref:LACTB2, winged helix domain n=1 Tax=Dillenia turbinata TaxID=194707 RepID=A0AAN8ZE51_9MAGN
MSIHKLSVIIKNPSNDDEFLLVKQQRPPKFGDEEYDSYVDSDLWDIPSVQLKLLDGDLKSVIAIEGSESYSQKIDLSKFDLVSALNGVLDQVGLGIDCGVHWTISKFVEEPEFGLGFIHTVFLLGKLSSKHELLPEGCKWMTIQSCLDLLLDVKASSERVGPSVVLGIINDSRDAPNWVVQSKPHYQEYPPGVVLVPLGSRTQKPFWTTNLVIFAPQGAPKESGGTNIVANGDALIVDPGCLSKHHGELMEIVAALPRKLVVFVTHHHHDHVDGLSVIQKCNPDTILLAHENTMRRIGKDDWSLGYTKVSGDEEICISGQRLNVISAPGHTDGHMALLHVSTHSLIAGDQCVGQGSAILDVTSGGNMTEYFKTTYKFLELAPHSLIPMHGRVNLWPKHMLCGYLKNRRDRESTILKAIENGAETLFDIVAYTYPDVDKKLWIPAASNVRLHVDHLAQQDKLPKEFSLNKFQASCGLHFISRWAWAYPSIRLTAKVLVTVAVAGFAVVYSAKNGLYSSKRGR